MENHDSGTMRVKIEVKNEFLGDSVFWEGAKHEINNIKNIHARQVAEHVFNTGEKKIVGMWHGEPC